MHIYAFGSICRGDVSPSSDVDLLAVVEGRDERFSPAEYSIYSYRRIGEIWEEGNPFAWHLSSESKIVYSSDQIDYLKKLGKPSPYKNCRRDCEKFFALFGEARESLKANAGCVVFDLSMVFLAIRNFATCYSLGMLSKPDFSRSAALRIGDDSLSIEANAYETLERARILSTRGVGKQITDAEALAAIKQFPRIDEWMTELVRRVL